MTLKVKLELIATMLLLCFFIFNFLALGSEEVTLAESRMVQADKAEAEEGITMVVTASRIPQEIEEAPVNVAVVTRQEIRQSGACTVDEVLRRVAGVSIISHGPLGSSSTVHLRGSTAHQVLVLVDGRPINSPQSGTVDLSRIPVGMIERIEVLKGPASALWGANALAGVINIITAAGRGSSKSSFKIEMGEYNTRIVEFTSQGHIKSLRYFFTAEKTNSDGYRQNSDYDGISFSGRFDYELSPRDYVVIDLAHHNGEIGTPGSLSWLTPRARQNDKQSRFDVQYDKVFSTAADMNVHVYLDNRERKYRDPVWGSSSLHKVNSMGMELQVNQSGFGDRHLFTYGGSLESDQVDSTNFGAKKERSNWAVFAQDIYQVTPSLALTVSGRYDNYSSHGDSFCGRGGWTYSLNSDTKLYASVGNSFRAPTFDDLYWHDDLFQMYGNPDLLPETAWAYEVGIKRYADNANSFTASVFRRDVKNLIDWEPVDPSADYSPWHVANVASARIQGFEASIQHELTAGLTGSLAYTYLDAKDKETNQPLPYVASNQGHINLTYATPSGFSASWQVNVTGERPTDRDTLPAYTVMNLVLAQEVKSGWEFHLKVENLLDEDYQESAGYPAPPRTVTVGASYTF